MLNQIPDPLTPQGCDLSDFQYMELDVRRLRDSRFSASVDGEAFRAGILLWCAAWHQIPAASLPDDDVELANLAGYGRVIKEWKKVRSEALHGFVKCSDGRLYHKVIAEKALSAYASKEKYAYGKCCERIRKENAKRKEKKETAFGIPTMEQWNSGYYLHGIPPENPQIPPETMDGSTGIPPETSLRGNGEGTEREQNRELIPSVADATDAAGGPPGQPGPPQKSPEDMAKAELWRAAVSVLEQGGCPPSQCRTFMGKLVTDYTFAVVKEAVAVAVTAQPADAREYLKATCQRIAGERKSPNKQEALEASNRAVVERLLAKEAAHAAQ